MDACARGGGRGWGESFVYRCLCIDVRVSLGDVTKPNHPPRTSLCPLTSDLDPVTCVLRTRELCEKLHVVVGSDELSREAQVRCCVCERGHARALAPACHCCLAGSLLTPPRLALLARHPLTLAPTTAPPVLQRNATLLFMCLLRSTLASKRVLAEYRLSRDAWAWLTGEVESR